MNARELRKEISEILVRNNLRTDQVAIGEIAELLEKAEMSGARRMLLLVEDILPNSVGFTDRFYDLKEEFMKEDL